MANDLIEQSTRKLNGSRPSILFGPHHKWKAILKPTAQHRSKELHKAHSYGLESLNDEQVWTSVDPPSEVDPPRSFRSKLVTNRALEVTVPQGVEANSTGSSTQAPAVIIASSRVPISDPVTTPIMETEETRTIVFPNFNRMYAKIHESLINRQQPLSGLYWKPSDYVAKTNQGYQLQYAANQVSSLMQSVSKSLNMKRSSLPTVWRTMGSRPREEGQQIGWLEPISLRVANRSKRAAISFFLDKVDHV